MIAPWMAYVIAVTLLMGGAGLCLERAAAALRLPTRAAWAGVLTAVVGIPLLMYRFGHPSASEIGQSAVGDVGGFGTPAPGAGAPAGSSVEPWLPSVLPLLDPPLALFWVVASLGLLIFGVLSHRRLEAEERGWSRVRLIGEDVWISSLVGPAVLGFFRQRIVVPAWVLDAPASLQRLILIHEKEHLKAGDSRLVLGGLSLLCLLPWNLPLWWIVHRLRLAVEVDCDARVLRRGVDARAYAVLLLEVIAHRSSRAFAMTAFKEPKSNLQRRLEMITAHDRGSFGFGSVLGVGLAAMLLTAACTLDQPRRAAITETRMDETESIPPLARQPQFTAFDRKPELLDPSTARRIVADAFPPALRDAGIGGITNLWVFIDEEGRVLNVLVAESSGRTELDSAAQGVMRRFRFSPARLGEQPVGVWIQLPVRFEAPAVGEMPDRGPAAAASAAGQATGGQSAEEPDGPTFTPYDVSPKVVNRGAVASMLESAYPAVLRSAGIGGTAVLWVHVGQEGRVIRTTVDQSSGHPELDGAAAAVMKELRFTPAMHGGVPVGVWIRLPITFSPDARDG